MTDLFVTYACGFLGYSAGLILALGCWHAATNISAWMDR